MEEMSDVEEVDSSEDEEKAVKTVDEDLHSESESVPEVSSSEDKSDSDDLEDDSDSSDERL